MKKEKNLKRILLIIILSFISLCTLICIGSVMYIILDFFIFDIKRNTVLLEDREIDENNRVKFYYLRSNATSANYLRLEFENRKIGLDTTINYRHYNYVEGISFNNDTLLFVAKVKKEQRISQADTIIVDLSKCLDKR